MYTSYVTHQRMSPEERLSAGYNHDITKAMKKYERLRNMDVFVLDNSIRESTVGQLRGHTTEAKWRIYEEVKKCGFEHIIVASLSNTARVDDVFIKELMDAGEDPGGLWTLSEVTEAIKQRVPDTESVPSGIRKLEKVGLYNVIFEVDLGDSTYNFEEFPVADMCALLKKWIVWCHDHLNKDVKVMVNIRDTPDVMAYNQERVFRLVTFLANLSKEIRPFGILFEEPRGKTLPEEVGMWAKYIRKAMKDSNWEEGQLLVHVHEKFGLSDATQIQAMLDGSTGIWASVCAEGAVIGQASSCVTLMNLVRLGNKKVLKKFNCSYLRRAAIAVTELTTGTLPHNKQPVFGQRALDFVFDLDPEEFDLAAFFGEKAPVRITTMASAAMIRHRLLDLFGDDLQFTLDLCSKMKELIIDDLRNGRQEEYMSEPGIALLFIRAGGKLTEPMREAIERIELTSSGAKILLKEIRGQWDKLKRKEAKQGGVSGNTLHFDTFYNGFMARYFSGYRLKDTDKDLHTIGMNNDGQVDWSEFLVYLKWALYQYPETETAQEVLDVSFQKGIIPAMKNEYLRNETATGLMSRPPSRTFSRVSFRPSRTK